MTSISGAQQRKNVAVLAICQALLLTNNATAIALNALAGYALAPDKHLATLPVTAWIVGAALTTFFASLLMKRIGRRAGFTLGALIGIIGAAVCSFALWRGSFWLFCAGASVLGVYNAFGGYYRFAAADAAAPEFRPRAIAYVLAGGLVGGVVGPATSRLTVGLLPVTYVATYLSLIGFMLLALLALRFLDIPPPTLSAANDRARPLLETILQPAFVVAVIAAAFGYGVMNLLMTATPLAMGMCGHAYGATATVISSHVVGMFAPSFVTGHLIRRIGVLRVMLLGVLLNFFCIAIALAGVELAHFWWSLVLLGVGWNFLYISATSLLTETYGPAEQAQAQGANDFFIFFTMAVSSFSSGVILERDGWQTLNYLSLPFIAAIGAAVLWLTLKGRAASAATKS
jgi:MFS family permease